MINVLPHGTHYSFTDENTLQNIKEHYINPVPVTPAKVVVNQETEQDTTVEIQLPVRFFLNTMYLT